MAVETQLKMPGTPKPWMNTVMRGLLETPGLRRWLGRGFALITVTGATTGTRYTTPVQHMEVDGHIVVLSQAMRTWWRNIRARPDVQLVIAGRQLDGMAAIADDARAHELIARCLRANPRVGRFYGLRPDDDGAFAAADLDRLLERVVVIDIQPS